MFNKKKYAMTQEYDKETLTKIKSCLSSIYDYNATHCQKKKLNELTDEELKSALLGIRSNNDIIRNLSLETIMSCISGIISKEMSKTSCSDPELMMADIKVAIWQCLYNFNPSYKITFTTYVYNTIKNKIWNSANSINAQDNHMSEYNYAKKRVVISALNSLGLEKDVTDEDVQKIKQYLIDNYPEKCHFSEKVIRAILSGFTVISCDDEILNNIPGKSETESTALKNISIKSLHDISRSFSDEERELANILMDVFKASPDEKHNHLLINKTIRLYLQQHPEKSRKEVKNLLLSLKMQIQTTSTIAL